MQQQPRHAQSQRHLAPQLPVRCVHVQARVRSSRTAHAEGGLEEGAPRVLRSEIDGIQHVALLEVDAIECDVYKAPACARALQCPAQRCPCYMAGTPMHMCRSYVEACKGVLGAALSGCLNGCAPRVAHAGEVLHKVAVSALAPKALKPTATMRSSAFSVLDVLVLTKLSALPPVALPPSRPQPCHLPQHQCDNLKPLAQ